MRIKHLSRIVCAAIVGLFILISYITSELVVVRGVDAIEGNTASEKMRQLRNHIHSQQRQIGHIAVDWACWDDAYRFMQDMNSEFIATNLRQPMLRKLRPVQEHGRPWRAVQGIGKSHRRITYYFAGI